MECWLNQSEINIEIRLSQCKGGIGLKALTETASSSMIIIISQETSLNKILNFEKLNVWEIWGSPSITD